MAPTANKQRNALKRYHAANMRREGEDPTHSARAATRTRCDVMRACTRKQILHWRLEPDVYQVSRHKMYVLFPARIRLHHVASLALAPHGSKRTSPTPVQSILWARSSPDDYFSERTYTQPIPLKLSIMHQRRPTPPHGFRDLVALPGTTTVGRQHGLPSFVKGNHGGSGRIPTRLSRCFDRVVHIHSHHAKQPR